jgi:hypothetical protein
MGVGIGVVAALSFFELPYAAVTTGLGAATGFFGNIAGQLLSNHFNWRCVSMKNALIAGGVGAAAGAAVGLAPTVFAGSMYSVVAFNGTVNMIQYEITQYANDDPITIGGASLSFAAGAVAGGLGGKFASGVPHTTSERALSASISNANKVSANIGWSSFNRGLLGSVFTNEDFSTAFSTDSKCDEGCGK